MPAPKTIESANSLVGAMMEFRSPSACWLLEGNDESDYSLKYSYRLLHPDSGLVHAEQARTSSRSRHDLRLRKKVNLAVELVLGVDNGHW
jgi:hypothetical protein